VTKREDPVDVFPSGVVLILLIGVDRGDACKFLMEENTRKPKT
jgi:hypothetical protein